MSTRDNREPWDWIGEELAHYAGPPPPVNLPRWLGREPGDAAGQVEQLAVLLGQLWEEWEVRLERDLRSIGLAALGRTPADGASFYRDMQAALTAKTLGEIEALAIRWDAEDPVDVARRLWLALDLDRGRPSATTGQRVLPME